MTREDAIKVLNMVEAHGLADEAKRMAIKALEQEPCEDAISRQAVIDLMADFELSMGQVVRGIHALPPVTPKQRTGHWIETWLSFWCSECKTQFGGAYKFCPNCGAKMIEPQESEGKDGGV